MANAYVNKVELADGTTLIDLSDATASASEILSGYTAYGADGSKLTGSLSTQTIYCGSSAPSASVGQDGDLYFVTSSGATLERYPESYTSSNLNSTSNLSSCIGVSAANGSATGNVYSSGSSVTGYAYYSFDLSDIPSNATITSVSCTVRAHEENASRSACTLQLYSGSTAKGSATTVDGTSNADYTLNCGSWTASELGDLKLVMAVGYYGGLIAGATLTIAYETTAQWTATLTGTTSSVTAESGSMYLKSNGSWSQVSSTTLGSLISIS